MNETQTAYAFPHEKKEPIGDAAHVRNAIARFNQVEGVTDAERDAAWKRIQNAAREFGVDLHEESWHDLAHGGKRQNG
jgi:cell division protein FtsX